MACRSGPRAARQHVSEPCRHESRLRLPKAVPGPREGCGCPEGQEKDGIALIQARVRVVPANERAADVDCNGGCGFRKLARGRSSFARTTRSNTACGMRRMRQAVIFFTEACRITNFSASH